MKALRVKVVTTSVAFVLFAGGVLTIAMTSGAIPAWAFERSKALHVTKDCGSWKGAAGEFCTIKASDFAPIKVDSKVYYDQAAGTPAGLLDSNVVLDAGTGDRAFGRCSVDLSNGSGLCTFSDGTGQFNGFQARIVVTPLGGTLFGWDGTYSFGLHHRSD